MIKKLFGFNIDVNLKKRLASVAKQKYTSSSALLNQIIEKYVDEFEGVVKEKKKVIEERPKRTEEGRLADWEWRKQQVKEGKLPVHMAEEYPVESEFQKDVYIQQEDLDFEKSIKASLSEKEV